jgi:long-chain-fatty-acid--CoA ligase ACSBG
MMAEYTLIIICIIFVSLCLLYKHQKIPYNDNKIVELLEKHKKANSKTIIDLLEFNRKKYPNNTALKYCRNNEWVSVSYKEYYNNVKKIAHNLNHWIGQGSKVAIIGTNSVGWVYAYLGSIMNNGISIGLYPSASSKMCQDILNDCSPDVLIVESDEQLSKFTNLNMSSIKFILYYSTVSENLISNFKIPVINMSVFMDDKNNVKLKKPEPSNIASIIYTSGTTGESKGVVITHENIMASLTSLSQELISSENVNITIEERIVSYLPLNHIAGQLFDIYMPIYILGTVYFADKDALKSSLVNTMIYVKPTIFLGVPRVWEKIMENIELKLEKIGLKGKIAKIFGKSKIVSQIGLNEVKLCFTGAAPISNGVKNYFGNLGLPLYDIYGLSETSGPITISLPNKTKIGSVGKLVDGIKLKILKNGEILLKGKQVSNGYYNKIITTYNKSSNNWFRTGDLGYIDDDGYLFITGRKKEIIITAGGENISPCPIEESVKSNISYIDHAVVIGDKRKFLSMLLVLKTEEDGAICKKAKKIDNSIISFIDAIKSKPLKDDINKKMEMINNNSVSNASKIQKWTIVPNQFIVGDELTATMKLRRNYISDKYYDLINEIYM